jgi:hypothetical protein
MVRNSPGLRRTGRQVLDGHIEGFNRLCREASKAGPQKYKNMLMKKEETKELEG